VGFRVSSGIYDQAGVNDAPPGRIAEYQSYLRALACVSPISLEACLLDSGDEEIASWHAERETNKNAADLVAQDRAAALLEGNGDVYNKAPKPVNENWKVDHYEVYTSHGITWPPNWADDDKLARAVEMLPPRQAEIAWFHSRLAAIRDLKCEAVIDVNMSLVYMRNELWNRADELPTCSCLVSTSRPFAVLAKREICGMEALHFQGIWGSSSFFH
jgi:hypothetical protein